MSTLEISINPVKLVASRLDRLDMTDMTLIIIVVMDRFMTSRRISSQMPFLCNTHQRITAQRNLAAHEPDITLIPIERIMSYHVFSYHLVVYSPGPHPWSHDVPHNAPGLLASGAGSTGTGLHRVGPLDTLGATGRATGALYSAGKARELWLLAVQRF